MQQCKNALWFTLVLCLLSVHAAAQRAVKPLRYWTFDGEQPIMDQLSGAAINITNYKCGFEEVAGMVGKGAVFSNPTCLAVTNALRDATTEFSIELLFKGGNVYFSTFSSPHLTVQFVYPRFVFKTTILVNNNNVVDNFVVDLKSSGRKSYNYYTDGKWHHLVFVANARTGVRQIWVDGVLEPGFEKKATAGSRFVFANNDAIRGNAIIDELAIYNKQLPPALVRQHFRQAVAGKHYTFEENASLSRAIESDAAHRAAQPKETYDPLEFAPGYPDYNVQLYDQLRNFPLPRYKPGVPMQRLVSWMNIEYLHRELPQPGGKGFGKLNPDRAVALSLEMAAHWNYYIELPVLRTTAAAAEKNYTNKNGLHGALINLVNSHPQYPWTTILIQLQGKPSHAGYERGNAFVTAQDLPARYYLTAENGQPVIHNRQKWLSPLMPLDIIQKDGKTSRFYLEQLLKHVKRPPALINENGEYFGHIRTEDLLKKDPKVYRHFRQSGMSLADYSGWFQHRLDSTYRAEIMQGFKAGETNFSFYNVSAVQPVYWPSYRFRRTLNRWNNKLVYSTPDFYPRFPDNWRTNQGAFNGYGTIAAGRVTEIAMGDQLFSPFVSAGWGEEERNVRPAQWLALLKSMVMLGADFFYVGYFNITGAGGKWPNGAGPNDPRGYAYQVAMPAYAQAVGSYVRDFITRGTLLNDAAPGDAAYQYRFKGNAENELILVRKLDKKFLICGSIQPNSNIKGNVPDEVITSIQLDDRKLRFPVRRQGSMYILDVAGKKPVFIQVDGWHEKTHPWYWSKDTWREAELPDNETGSGQVETENKSGSAYDFSDFTTYLVMHGNNNPPRYVFSTRKPGPQYCFVRARVTNGKRAVLQVNVEGKENGTGNLTVASSDWNWYIVKTPDQNRPLPVYSSENNPVTLVLRLASGSDASLQIDKLMLRDDTGEPYPAK